MTTNTMVAIQSVTVTGSAASSITFGTGGTIPQTYTDLQLVINGTCTSGTDTNIFCTFNGVTTGTPYSMTFLYGDGSSAASGRDANINYLYAGRIGTTQTTSIVDLNNYSNTTTYKTLLSRGNNTAGIVIAQVGTFRSTSAITSITLTVQNGSNFSVGTTATLYGIANADIGAYATGGIITQDSTYYYHAFGSSGTFTPSRNLTADILVVAGGGGGGGGNSSPYWLDGGGGGAGGVVYAASASLSNGTGYTCTIGAPGGGSNTGAGGSGNNSIFGSFTALGGGGGASSNNSPYTGISGGSGGGGAGGQTGSTTFVGGSATQTSGTGYVGYGNAGGTGQNGAGNNPSGGGGGAGSAGANGVASVSGGAGGNGLSTWSTWLAAGGYGVLNPSDNLRYIAGGGGSGMQQSSVTSNGGLGGGGSTGVAGVVNTGSGGGGSSGTTQNAAAGGSGLIIVRYAK